MSEEKKTFTLDENLVTAAGTSPADKAIQGPVMPPAGLRWPGLVASLLLGTAFGFVLLKGEIASWFRMQEMFRLGSLHMYGYLVSAVFTASLFIGIVRLFSKKAGRRQAAAIYKKPFSKGNVWGGLLFGIGWALGGACPGPMLALPVPGHVAALVMLGGALAGTLLYAWLRDSLPH